MSTKLSKSQPNRPTVCSSPGSSRWQSVTPVLADGSPEAATGHPVDGTRHDIRPATAWSWSNHNARGSSRKPRTGPDSAKPLPLSRPLPLRRQPDQRRPGLKASAIASRLLRVSSRLLCIPLCKPRFDLSLGVGEIFPGKAELGGEGFGVGAGTAGLAAGASGSGLTDGLLAGGEGDEGIGLEEQGVALAQA